MPLELISVPLILLIRVITIHAFVLIGQVQFITKRDIEKIDRKKERERERKI